MGRYYVYRDNLLRSSLDREKNARFVKNMPTVTGSQPKISPTAGLPASIILPSALVLKAELSSPPPLLLCKGLEDRNGRNHSVGTHPSISPLHIGTLAVQLRAFPLSSPWLRRPQIWGPLRTVRLLGPLLSVSGRPISEDFPIPASNVHTAI